MEGIMKKDFIRKHYSELLEIFNCIRVGIWITDNETNTILVNDESCKTGGLTREEVMGKKHEGPRGNRVC